MRDMHDDDLMPKVDAGAMMHRHEKWYDAQGDPRWGNCMRGCPPAFLNEAGFCSPACVLGAPRGEFVTEAPARPTLEDYHFWIRYQRDKSMKALLIQARSEILSLRRRNELLAAQVAVVEVFSVALGLRPEPGGMTPDIAWELQCRIDQMDKEPNLQ